MMLIWSGRSGAAREPLGVWTLGVKPQLTFEFDGLSYDDSMTSNWSTLGDATTSLTADQIAECIAWVTAHSPYQATGEVVHGVDANGKYLGLTHRLSTAIAAVAPHAAPDARPQWTWISNEWLYVATLAERQENAWEAIKRFRDARQAGGVKVGLKWFHTDVDSRIKQIGLVMMGANIPANLNWKTMDGTFTVMTPTMASQIFGSVAAFDQATFAKAEQHKAAMLASATPEAYDFSTGWPAIYGE
jgi:hypothetical protein